MTYECRHIMHNGAKCKSPALRGKPFCYYHARLHRFTAAPPVGPMDNIRLPILEDRSAIQVALAQVLDALASARLDPRRAGLFLYALQIATRNVDRTETVLPHEPVDTITETSDGDELGPVQSICEPPNDCATCSVRLQCGRYEPTEEEEEALEDEYFGKPTATT
jgi:ferredoxin